MNNLTGVAIIDMDGTILSKRSIDVLCSTLGFTQELEEINKWALKVPAYKVTEQIAKLLAGKRKRELEEIFSSIPLEPNAEQFINYLKNQGFIVAIATDSFQFLGENLAKRLGINKVYGNILEFKRDRVTGKVLTKQHCMKIQGCREFAVCKLWYLNKLKYRFNGISICIGDSDSDLCAFIGADIAIAYKPKSLALKEKAHKIVSSFQEAIKFLEESLVFNRFFKEWE
ncbi:MAG: HAD-IB family phosphatase [Candidatus Bathyarchaeia archaeon]|nr:HAD-IB family phosphatase [Candidatus Bathyarchaeota archaeon]